MSPDRLRRVFSAQLRYWMKQRGISAEALAGRVGLPKRTLSSWLEQKSLPSVDELALVAGALEVEPAALVRPAEPRRLP